MKKLITIGAIVLSMAMLIVSCSNPAGGKPETKLPEGQIQIPSVSKPTAPSVEVTKPEGYTPSTNAKAVTTEAEFEALGKAIDLDAMSLFDTIAEEFTTVGDEVESQVSNPNYDPNDKNSSPVNNPMIINLDGKDYSKTHSKLNLKKANAFFKYTTNEETNGFTYAGLLDLDGSLSFDGSKVEVLVKEGDTSYSRPNSIKAASLSVVAKGGANISGTIVTDTQTDPDGHVSNITHPKYESTEGALSLALSGKVLFDTDVYAGYGNIKATVYAKDFAELKKAILTQPDEIKEIADKATEGTATADEIEKFSAWIDTLPVAVTLSFNITDSNEKPSYTIIDAKTSGELYTFIYNIDGKKNSNKK